MFDFPFLPDTAKAVVKGLALDLGAAELNVLAAYLAGAAQVKAPTGLAAASTVAAAAVVPDELAITILFGSQSGNAERSAQQLYDQCQQAGLQKIRLVRADRYKTKELKDEQILLIVISTQGEGDPPDDAKSFVDFLAGSRAPQLPQLQFGILGLGDSSYPLFCGIAQTIENRLVELGAQQLLSSGLADVDIETVAAPWREQALQKLQALQQTAPAATASVSGVGAVSASVYSREQPFKATLLENQAITARGSSRDVRHFELDLTDSQLSYAPGDSLGVWPIHDQRLVAAILQSTGLDGAEPVTVADISRPLAEWLSHYRELTQLTRPFLQQLAELGGHQDLQAALQPEAHESFKELVSTHQLLDALNRFPAKWTATTLVHALRALAPRMYSIASSQNEVGEEVHLTVANVQYRFEDEERWGAASNYLSQLSAGDEVMVFVEANSRFKLPENEDADIIMIGPGTGVAPFRAFVQERQNQQGTGRNWLFFGNPHFTTDFLYQNEWLRALEDGALDQLDVAFSRDQAEKIYVQHRLREKAAELYQWIQNGAHIYVCGDANQMAKDVHHSLQQIAQQEGGLDEVAASQWLDQLSAQGRYARDVY